MSPCANALDDGAAPGTGDQIADRAGLLAAGASRRSTPNICRHSAKNSSL
jgi:hypothetical protein